VNATPHDLPVLQGDRFRLRPLLPSDAPSLQRHADDREVWFNLFDGFPSPYTLADAERWCGGAWREAGDVLGIEVDGAVAGVIGGRALRDAGRQCNAELGWWIGRAFWGRGIVPRALTLFTDWTWRQRPALTRLQATIYARNARSQRVAQKAGWVHEGLLRQSIVKDGSVLDAQLWATYRALD
jgi:RimJ/RimL family protein N-acetyltransferase